MTRGVIAIRVQPGARCTEVTGHYGDAVRIRVAAVPERGKANAALVEFMASKLGVAKSCVEIIRGQTGHEKLVAVEGLEADEIHRRLLG